jgi:Xaa-Pro aminopeptidase
MVEEDDIVSIDLGPVFEEYEADFGRTYVLGSDPSKIRLCEDLQRLFTRCREAYLARPSMTGAELYELVVSSCVARGWGFGGAHAGHLVGRFPISREDRDAARNRIRPDNHTSMNAPDRRGAQRNWILEIHLLDPTDSFGGFFEDRL